MPLSDYDDVKAQAQNRGVLFTLYKETDDPERPEAIGKVEVRFDRSESGEEFVSETWVHSYHEALTPTELGRFPWAKWIRAAETIHRTPRPTLGPPTAGNVMERLELDQQQWSDYARQVQAEMGRSGRRRLDDSHYQRIARMYQALAASGEHAPVKKLAERLDANYHTVSRWIKTARDKEFLPDGRQGRAG